MKTKMNILKAAKTGLVSLTLFAAPAFIFANESNDSAPVYDRMDQIAMNIENSLRYVAPAEETVLLSEAETADAVYMRLDYMMTAIEESIRYKAPEVSEDIEEYELNAAMERLENHFLAVEQSIKF